VGNNRSTLQRSSTTVTTAASPLRGEAGSSPELLTTEAGSYAHLTAGIPNGGGVVAALSQQDEAVVVPMERQYRTLDEVEAVGTLGQQQQRDDAATNASWIVRQQLVASRAQVVELTNSCRDVKLMAQGQVTALMESNLSLQRDRAAIAQDLLELRNQNSALHRGRSKEVDELKLANAALFGSNTALREQIGDLESRIGAVERSRQGLESAASMARNKLAALEKEKAAVERSNLFLKSAAAMARSEAKTVAGREIAVLESRNTAAMKQLAHANDAIRCLQEQTKSEEASNTCGICMTAPRSVLFTGCAHMGCCFTCATAVRKNRSWASTPCPWCQAPIKGIIKGVRLP